MGRCGEKIGDSRGEMGAEDRQYLGMLVMLYDMTVEVVGLS